MSGNGMDKRALSERDICTKFITPAILKANWQPHLFREEVNLTAGRVVVRGNTATRVSHPEVPGGPPPRGREPGRGPGSGRKAGESRAVNGAIV